MRRVGVGTRACKLGNECIVFAYTHHCPSTHTHTQTVLWLRNARLDASLCRPVPGRRGAWVCEQLSSMARRVCRRRRCKGTMPQNGGRVQADGKRQKKRDSLEAANEEKRKQRGCLLRAEGVCDLIAHGTAVYSAGRMQLCSGRDMGNGRRFAGTAAAHRRQAARRRHTRWAPLCWPGQGLCSRASSTLCRGPMAARS